MNEECALSVVHIGVQGAARWSGRSVFSGNWRRYPLDGTGDKMSGYDLLGFLYILLGGMDTRQGIGFDVSGTGSIGNGEFKPGEE